MGVLIQFDAPAFSFKRSLVQNTCPCLSMRITPAAPLRMTTAREHCQTTLCTEEGLFPEGICHPDFCQCDCTQGFKSCLDSLKHCEEGTFFNTITQVCDWPWNNPECSNPGTVTTP